LSVEISALAWQADLSDVYQVVILTKLADNANAQGWCYPSIPYVAAKCKVSVRKAQQVIKDLSVAGHLTIHERPGRSSVYRMRIPLKMTGCSGGT
jgi:hypothetical protein